MKTPKYLFNILIITAVLYLLFALVNGSFSTLDWTTASKVVFTGVTLLSWTVYIEREIEK